MGELRHFSDVPGLEDVVVVDPKWLADLMAQIVTTDKTRMQNLGPNKGWTSMDALLKVVEMKCTPGTGRVTGLVRLMQHCGLVYALPSGDAVIPPMLPDRMKEPWESIRYKYGRLLDHRLSRLLCRLLLLLPDAEVRDVWRFGALLVRPQRALMALTCTRQETSNEYTLHVAVCTPAPELLGARVSALLGEELGGVEANTQTCNQCGAELPLAPFIRSLRLDEQAARWGPDQQEGDSEGCRSLRHLLAGIELHADWLAAAAGAAAGSGEPSDGPGRPGSASSSTTGVHDAPPLLRLRLVCEHPEGPHPVEGHPGYDIPPLYDDPGAPWLRTHARGLRPLMRAMELMWRHGPQEAQGPAGGSGEAGQQVGAPDVCQALLSLQVELERLEVGAEGGDEDEVAAKLDMYVSCQEARR
ncbi:hypothetical protein GPECTOR_257g652 [Gonium pectorale]|uniref:Uncharacterized protein n=1 Tax=Gonium pectorale TaxID=33097 RepID=A0A150FWB9_GONPE|nr:hypothetical protein GPECTOR_257g652 [Gonium pectorale]|eukprot:KXZ41868.1 hypothetical protein GPECTOR_257g652 [Gonium pectorale]